MKLVSKADLTYKSGLLVTKEGEVINNAPLVEQANRIFEMKKLNDFVESNRAEIEASSEPLVYHNAEKKVYFTAETPFTDKQIEEGATIWDELQQTNNADISNELVEEFPDLLVFIMEEDVLVTGTPTSDRFISDPLEIKGFFSIIGDWVELNDLRSMIKIKD